VLNLNNVIVNGVVISIGRRQFQSVVNTDFVYFMSEVVAEAMKLGLDNLLTNAIKSHTNSVKKTPNLFVPQVQTTGLVTSNSYPFTQQHMDTQADGAKDQPLGDIFKVTHRDTNNTEGLG
jgi:hypothetical protein